MTLNDNVVIVYDYVEPDYEHTDAIIRRVIGPDWYQVERWDGTTAKYHEACIQKVQDHYESLEEAPLPELPECICPIQTLMINGCKCGGI